VAKQSDIDLMLYADGELPGAEAEELRQRLSGSEADRTKIEALGQVGEVLRGALELSADDAAANPKMQGLWSRIESEISTERPAAAQRVSAPAQSGDSLWSRVREFFSGSLGGHFVTGAVAAAVVALVMSGGSDGGDTTTVKIRDRGVTQAAPVVDLESQPPEVENLEVYDGSGMILTIPGDDDDSSTAVIWITEDHTVEGPI